MMRRLLFNRVAIDRPRRDRNGDLIASENRLFAPAGIQPFADRQSAGRSDSPNRSAESDRESFTNPWIKLSSYPDRLMKRIEPTRLIIDRSPRTVVWKSCLNSTAAIPVENKMNLPQDFKEFIELLNLHNVKYLVTGGYAVCYHEYPRMTGHIDFIVERSGENAARIEAVLIAFGFGELGLTANDFIEPDTIVQLGFPPNRIDIITSISGVTFDEAWRDRIPDEIDGSPLNFIGKQALIANKKASGRPKDLADCHALSDPGVS